MGLRAAMVGESVCRGEAQPPTLLGLHVRNSFNVDLFSTQPGQFWGAIAPPRAAGSSI